MITALLAAGAAASFTLTSPDLPKGKPIGNKHVFNSFGCSGENVSPALEWKGAPKSAKSFALTVYDPDAPTGSGWWHWVVYNLTAGTTKLAAGAGCRSNSAIISRRICTSRLRLARSLALHVSLPARLCASLYLRPFISVV